MSLLDLLFPRRCVSCGKLGGYFCKRCISQIEFIKNPICPLCAKPAIDGATHPRCKTPLGLDGMYAAAHFKGPVKKAIHQIKYQYVSDLVQFLTSVLVTSYSQMIPIFDFLTPVPLHPKREKYRGFNQSSLLTQILGKKWGIPVKDNILIRIKETRPQADLKKEERMTNVRGIFICKETTSIKGKTIGLVDDVATTRSTLFECAKVLKRNGAKSVWGIVLAHG